MAELLSLLIPVAESLDSHNTRLDHPNNKLFVPSKPPEISGGFFVFLPPLMLRIPTSKFLFDSRVGGSPEGFQVVGDLHRTLVGSEYLQT